MGGTELGAQGNLPANRLPSFIDDILDYLSVNKFTSTGRTEKIYVDTAVNRNFRWLERNLWK